MIKFKQSIRKILAAMYKGARTLYEDFSGRDIKQVMIKSNGQVMISGYSARKAAKLLELATDLIEEANTIAEMRGDESPFGARRNRYADLAAA